MTPLAPIGSMPFMPFGPLGGADATASSGAAAAGDAVSPTASSAGGFASMLSNAVSGLNGQLVDSEKLSEQAATGGLADPTVALVAVEKADLAFNTAVQVRNKIVDGWQELSRMSV